MAICACHQPNYLPWVGYFYKIKLSNIFVILDSVQFPRGSSWVNRNRIKTRNGQLWLTVPVKKKGLGLQIIKNVMIDNTHRWNKNHLLTLIHFYKKATYFSDYIKFFENLYTKKWDNLLALNLEIIQQIMEWLEIKTKIILSSTLKINSKGSDLLLEICENLGADVYLSGVGASKKYINEKDFLSKNIKLKFFNYRPTQYSQLWGEFIPNLSIIDLLFNCGKKGFDLQMHQISVGEIS